MTSTVKKITITSSLELHVKHFVVDTSAKKTKTFKIVEESQENLT